MSRISSLQDPFLNALRREKTPVSIYLVNGIKLQGQIEAFDQFSVVLRNTVNQMVFKHAISTIVPAKAVRIVYSNYNPTHQNNDAQNDSSEDTSSAETSENETLVTENIEETNHFNQ